jgi:8-oxo-dGTP diphosphatase
MTFRWIAVVAGALVRDDGRWLMHRRPPGKHHAGLWEFPGGKIEPDEMPLESLIRELDEELGIACDPLCCTPVNFAAGDADDSAKAIVILLYTVTRWSGEPQALEGGDVGWFTPNEIAGLAKPPLDVALAERLFQNR